MGDVGEIYRGEEGLGRSKVDERNERADDFSTMLDVLVTDFFTKIGIPVRMQIPITFIRGGVLIMKGLLFSDEMRTAFSKAPPEVRVVRPSGGFLDEVHVDREFFERIVMGEAEMVRKGVHDGAAEVIEA